MTETSIGLTELSSVAAGFAVADTVLKGGNVRLLLSRSICSGKYIILVGGDTAAVEAAVAAGAEAADGCLIDIVTLPNLHPDVFLALGRTQPVEPTGALGILESFNVAALARPALLESAAVPQSPSRIGVGALARLEEPASAAGGRRGDGPRGKPRRRFHPRRPA